MSKIVIAYNEDVEYYIDIYFIQFKDPWFHSWYRPNNKIIKKVMALVKGQWVLEFIIFIVNGMRRIISTSKIKKMTASRKNRIEKGARV